MSSEAMRAIFDNLTSGAGRRAEQECNTNSAAHHKANSMEVNVKSARLSTQMHVTDWAEAQHEDPEIETTMDWCHQQGEIGAMDGAAGEAQVQTGVQEEYFRGKEHTAEH